MKRARNILIAVNSLTVFGVVLFVIASNIAMELDIKCNLVEMAHLYCPGCGGTRAVYALLRLDILSTIRYNVAVPFGVFVYAYYDIGAIVALVRKNSEYWKNQKFILIYIFIGVLLLNFILRNILVWCFGVDLIGDILHS